MDRVQTALSTLTPWPGAERAVAGLGRDAVHSTKCFGEKGITGEENRILFKHMP
jgi:hypothetical protein